MGVARVQLNGKLLATLMVMVVVVCLACTGTQAYKLHVPFEAEVLGGDKLRGEVFIEGGPHAAQMITAVSEAIISGNWLNKEHLQVNPRRDLSDDATLLSFPVLLWRRLTPDQGAAARTGGTLLTDYTINAAAAVDEEGSGSDNTGKIILSFAILWRSGDYACEPHMPYLVSINWLFNTISAAVAAKYPQLGSMAVQLPPNFPGHAKVDEGLWPLLEATTPLHQGNNTHLSYVILSKCHLNNDRQQTTSSNLAISAAATTSSPLSLQPQFEVYNQSFLYFGSSTEKRVIKAEVRAGLSPLVGRSKLAIEVGQLDAIRRSTVVNVYVDEEPRCFGVSLWHVFKEWFEWFRASGYGRHLRQK